jgi:hypothetical protein
LQPKLESFRRCRRSASNPVCATSSPFPSRVIAQHSRTDSADDSSTTKIGQFLARLDAFAVKRIARQSFVAFSKFFTANSFFQGKRAFLELDYIF